MKKKIFSLASIIFLLLVFVNSVSAASLDVLELKTEVDKESYNYDEAILSTLELENISETNNAENIRVQVDLPEEVELLEADDLTVDGQSVLWEFDQINALENEEISFKTVLPQPEEVVEETPSEETPTEETPSAETPTEETPADELPGEGGPAEEDTDSVTVVGTDDGGTSDSETVVSAVDETKPQTGDESSIFMYVSILILSIALVIFVVLGIRKKKAAAIAATTLAVVLAIPLLTATTVNAYEATQEQSISKTYVAEIEGEEYEYVVTVTAEVTDEITEIAVDPESMILNPGESKGFTITGTTTSGNSVDLVEDEQLTFEVSDPDKLEVAVGENGLEAKATDAAETDDEITVTAIYNSNGENLTASFTVKIEDFTGTLSGQVFDAVTEEPIEGATVEVNVAGGENITLTTDADGAYETEVKAGTHTVTGSKEGYIAESEQFTIQPNETTTADIDLHLVSEELGGEGTVSGQITDALTGEGVPGATIEVVRGKNNPSGEVLETITTDENGNYSVDLNGGHYTLLVSNEGYVSTTKNVIAIGGEEQENQNATITPELDEEEMRIVLTWGETPRDLDSHLTGPKADGSGRFHIYYGSKNYADDNSEVNLDLDDVSSYGPETVTVLKYTTSGTYKYNVFNYTGSWMNDENEKDLSKSSAKVELYKGSALVQTYNVPTNKVGNMWKVFEVVDGEIKTINSVESYDQHPNADNQ